MISIRAVDSFGETAPAYMRQCNVTLEINMSLRPSSEKLSDRVQLVTAKKAAKLYLTGRVIKLHTTVTEVEDSRNYEYGNILIVSLYVAVIGSFR